MYFFPFHFDLEDDQADLVNGDAVDQTTDEEVVKKNKRKK